ncbi:hypothetical protein [Deinococcus sp.]|uniref:hypothetical protein n=1 Tax=Deinococcus sp. TaxID=47478 RepID=UPI003C7E724C
MKPWAAEEIARLTAIYGTVPPPWIIAPAEHPYSLYWRMGGGEAHVMVWSAWWAQQGGAHTRPTEVQALDYFRDWPPPPVWLPWLIDVLWKPEDWEADEEVAAGTEDYFTRTEALGFGGRADYERDSEEPKWSSEDEDEVN